MLRQVAVVTPAAGDPVSLATAKAHLRILHDSEDAVISRLVAAACRHAERTLGRALGVATYDLILSEFPAESHIDLPRPPLVAVSSITYLDTAGATQTLASSSYQVDAGIGIAGRVALADGASWPATKPSTRAVTVRFSAGYAEPPDDLVSAILLHVGHLYVHREAAGESAPMLPFAYDSLMDPFRTHGWI